MNPVQFKFKTPEIFHIIAILTDLIYIPFLSLCGATVLTIAIGKGYYLTILTTALLYALSYYFRFYILKRFKKVKLNIPEEILFILLATLIALIVNATPMFLFLSNFIPNFDYGDVSYEKILESSTILGLFPSMYFIWISIAALILFLISFILEKLKPNQSIANFILLVLSVFGAITIYEVFSVNNYEKFYMDNPIVLALTVGSPISYTLALIFGFYNSPLLQKFTADKNKWDGIYQRLEKR